MSVTDYIEEELRKRCREEELEHDELQDELQVAKWARSLDNQRFHPLLNYGKTSWVEGLCMQQEEAKSAKEDDTSSESEDDEEITDGSAELRTISRTLSRLSINCTSGEQDMDYQDEQQMIKVLIDYETEMYNICKYKTRTFCKIENSLNSFSRQVFSAKRFSNV